MGRRRINPAKRLKVVASPADVRRFLDKVEVEAEPRKPRIGPCWRWTACTDDAAYGQFKFRGVALWAHRFAYALFRGTIPDALQIDHACDNPNCVNPHHLRRQTQARNIARSNRQRATKRPALATACVFPPGYEPDPDDDGYLSI